MLKRRGEAVEDLSSSQEFVPVEKVRPQAKPIVPKAKSISKGSAGGDSGEGTSDDIPIPSGLTNGARLCANSHEWHLPQSGRTRAMMNSLILPRKIRSSRIICPFCIRSFWNSIWMDQERARHPTSLATWPSLDLSRM